MTDPLMLSMLVFTWMAIGFMGGSMMTIFRSGMMTVTDLVILVFCALVGPVTWLIILINLLANADTPDRVIWRRKK